MKTYKYKNTYQTLTDLFSGSNKVREEIATVTGTLAKSKNPKKGYIYIKNIQDGRAVLTPILKTSLIE